MGSRTNVISITPSNAPMTQPAIPARITFTSSRFRQRNEDNEQGADGDGEGLVVCMVRVRKWVGIDRAAPSL